MTIEHKTLGFELTGLDYEGRTLEGYAAAFGNIDSVNDIIHKGAFAKTLNERGGKIKFLWQHKTDEPIGKIHEMREDPRGLFIKAVISDTTRGRDALALLKDSAIEGMSIGYEAIKGATDYTSEGDKNIRNLREVKLHEVSLVTFPANEEAQVTALKQDEEKAVMKSEGDGDHPASHYLVVEDPEKPTTWHLRVRNVAGEIDHRLMGGAWAALHGGYRGNVYEGPGKAEALAKLKKLYASEGLDTPKAVVWDFEIADQGNGYGEEKAGRVLAARNAARIMKAIDSLNDALRDAGLLEIAEEIEETTAPEKAADNEDRDDKAGPDKPPPTSNAQALLKMIEIEQEQLDLLEV